MKTVFVTVCMANYWSICRTDDFIKSFKKFHPDVELLVYSDNEINELFATDPRLNLCNEKATVCKKLAETYDRVVWIDADHLIFDRLDSVFDEDYDVACPSNFNVKYVTGITVNTINNWGGTVEDKTLITYEQFLQGGIIACTSKLFWQQYEYASLNYGDFFPFRDNDVLNVLAYMLPYKRKFLDGAPSCNDEGFKAYYGCASLGQEKQIQVVDNKLMLNGFPVKSYHIAHGGGKASNEELFSPEVVEWINSYLLA